MVCDRLKGMLVDEANGISGYMNLIKGIEASNLPNDVKEALIRTFEHNLNDQVKHFYTIEMSMEKIGCPLPPGITIPEDVRTEYAHMLEMKGEAYERLGEHIEHLGERLEHKGEALEHLAHAME